MEGKFFSRFLAKSSDRLWIDGGDSCQTCPFLVKEKEQAEVGQGPTLLAIRAANGVLRILRGYSSAFLPVKEKKTGYLGVSSVSKKSIWA